MGWGTACSWGHSPAALIPPRATSSLLPPTPTPPGRLAMIVTEYMENGSLDAFLRVRAPLCSPRGPGEGSSVWVMGDHERPPNTPSSPELGPNRPGEGGARHEEGQPMQVPFSTPSRESPSAVGPAALFCTQAEWCLCGDPGPHPVGKHGRGPETPRFPAFARSCVCWVVRDRATPLWVSLSPWAKWMTSPHTPPAYLSGLLGG